MKVTITKTYKSSDKTETIIKTFPNVGTLVHFFNNSMTRDAQEEIFTDLTYNDPGGITWEIDVDGYDFEIKTWREINIAIQGLFIGVNNSWSEVDRYND